MSQSRALGNYSRVLSSYGGYARINDSQGTVAMLDNLPESVEIWIDDNHSSHAKKVVKELSLGKTYFKHFIPDSATLKMMANWLVKLPIHELQMRHEFNIPKQMLSVLHLASMLVSLHLPSLKDCAWFALSECKSLRKLTLSRLFDGKESPEKIVEKQLDIVGPTTIQELKVSLPEEPMVSLPGDWQKLSAQHSKGFSGPLVSATWMA
ncbi:hypothetical protein HDU81_008476 [Chytriomyces hyalinus]|nr:hypothetical protein HDU81_008476 [Chytriomyces hyalinus]